MSQFHSFRTYRLKTFMVKANDDLRQEVLAIQLLKRLKRIFDHARLSLYLRPYEIFISTHNSGMLEFIPDTVSLDALKKTFPKNSYKPWTLRTFYQNYFNINFEEA